MHCHIDCYSGVSGDMLLGAIVDAGISIDELGGRLASLDVPGWRLHADHRGDPRIGGTKVEVQLVAGHDDHHRGLADIVAIIEGAEELPDVVRAQACRVFGELAEAEAQVHGVPIDEIHFHEVGAVDAIIDIVGVCLGFHLLGVDSLSSGPLPLGSGTVKCAHGILPVPAPATALLLRGLPTVPGEGEHPTGELVTPTGAALVRVLCDAFGAPPMVLERVAWGLGGRDRGPIPNAVRLLLGTLGSSEAQEVDVLTATIDDMDPRLFGPLASRLLHDGALDVTLCPVYGKKGRPAIEVTALCPPDRQVRARLEERVFSETTTLGLRWRREQRATLARRFEVVETAFGPVTVKQGLRLGRVLTSQPEFDSCVAASEVHDVPVRRVIEAALAALPGRDDRTSESDPFGPVE